jgi:acyl-CoA synthetase (AMP-forming)/AMP-acid ligase II
MNRIGHLAVSEIQRFVDRVEEARTEHLEGAVPSIETLAGEWSASGVRAGDVVILALTNGVGLLRQFFGVLAAGGVPALVAPNAPSARLQRLAETLGARAVGAIHVPRGVGVHEQHRRIGHIRAVFFAEREKPAAVRGEAILLTSGTSGFGSGCVFGMEALFLNGARHADAIGQQSDDTVLVNLPLHFSFALVAQALATLQRGGKLVIAAPPFHTPTYVEALKKHRVTVTSLTPVLVRSLLQPGVALPRHVRTLTVGGDALAAEEVGHLLKARPGHELYLTYGLTQAGPRVSTLAAHREPPERHGTVGLPLPGTKTWLEDVRDMPGRRQLIVASDTVMRRRIGLVEGRGVCDEREPGVVATGDLFDLDADGYLYFKGRLSDFIVRGGDKICLAAIRRVATELPHVARAGTRILATPCGVTDYELILSVSRGTDAGPDEFRAQLGKLLCRGEMPGSISVVPWDKSSAGYK